MTVKLNLTIDETTVTKAKKFAAKNNVSISKLVDDYLSKLTLNDIATSKQSFTKKFAASVTNSIVDIDKTKQSYLNKKYGK